MYLYGATNGAVSLYHNNVERFKTTTAGINLPTAGDYVQFTGGSSNAWAIGSTGGNVTPGTAGTTLGFHRWSGSAWTNPVNIDSSGNVGINSTAMGSWSTSGNFRTVGQELQIDGGASAGGYAGLGMTTSTNGTTVGGLYFANEDNSNAGGTTSRVVAAISSAMITSDSNSGDDSGGDLNFWIKAESGSPAVAMIIDSAGDVGIGTTAPNAASFGAGVKVLSIEGVTTADFGAIEMTSTCAGTAGRLGDVRFVNKNGTGSLVAQAGIRGISDGAVDSTALAFYTEVTGGSFAEKMRITSAGTVGIGTTTPAAGRIHAKQATTNYDGIVIEASASDRWLRMGHNGTNAQIHTTYNSSGGTSPLILATHAHQANQLYLATDGNVGIGGAPSTLLHLNTTVNQADHELLRLQQQNSTRAAGDEIAMTFYGHDSGGSDRKWAEISANLENPTANGTAGLDFYGLSGGTEALVMTMLGSGNVGIGTTNPGGNRLYVQHSTTAGAINTAPVMRIKNGAGSGNYVAMHFGGAVSDGFIGFLDHSTASSRMLSFAPDGSVSTMQIKSGGAIKNPVDSAGFYTGAGDDLRIFHSGTHSYIDNSTGSLVLRVNGSENAVVADANGAVNLYYDNVAKLATTAAGVAVTGTLASSGDVTTGSAGAGKIRLMGSETNSAVWWYTDGTYGKIHRDNSTGNMVIQSQTVGTTNLLLQPEEGVVTNPLDNSGYFTGASDDLRMYHGSGTSYILNATGPLVIKQQANSRLRMVVDDVDKGFDITNNAQSETMFSAYADGAVTLYYDNVVKLATASGGVSVTGTLSSTAYITSTSGMYVGIAPGAESEAVHLDSHSNGAGTSALYIGNAAITVSSDYRAKRDIVDYSGSALDVIDKARVVEFDYIPEMIGDTGSGYGPSSRGRYVGTIAQEMKEWAPWAINDGEGDPEGEHIWKAEYDHVVPLLLKGIQELRKEINYLKKGVK